MQNHEYSDIFPLIPQSELKDLADDILENGLRHPILLYNGKILDGRNRYLACKSIGVIPKTKDFEGTDSDALNLVWSENFHRRHLDKSQASICIVEKQSLVDRFRAEAKEAQRESALLNQPQNSQKIDHSERTYREKNESKSSAKIAKLAGTNRQYISDAQKIVKESPKLAEEIKSGKKTIPQAKREIKKQETIKNLESLQVKQVKAIQGLFDVIVIDPPWPMKKIDRDCRPNQVEFDYPTMSIDEICSMKIPACDDCHLWLWTTHRFLKDAVKILDAWDFKYVCGFVWHKPGGFQPIGLPQYNCEFALYARKGTPIFIDTKQFPTCFRAPRGKHSEKPEEFYDIVRRVTSGRRLDMFNRRKIEGFEVWGNEAGAI